MIIYVHRLISITMAQLSAISAGCPDYRMNLRSTTRPRDAVSPEHDEHTAWPAIGSARDLRVSRHRSVLHEARPCDASTTVPTAPPQTATPRSRLAGRRRLVTPRTPAKCWTNNRPRLHTLCEHHSQKTTITSHGPAPIPAPILPAPSAHRIPIPKQAWYQSPENTARRHTPRQLTPPHPRARRRGTTQDQRAEACRSAEGPPARAPRALRPISFARSGARAVPRRGCFLCARGDRNYLVRDGMQRCWVRCVNG